MLGEKEAEKALIDALPGISIRKSIVYNGLFVFMIRRPGKDPEAFMDPFYSVNPQNGEVDAFSLITDGDISEISALFRAAEERSSK